MSRRNFSKLTHPIHSIGSKTHVLGHFRPLLYSTKVDAKLAELVPLSHKFAKKVVSEFLATNAPDPLHWTQNSCFGAFRTISLLHESRSKLGELVPLTHKFAKQSRVGTFRNQRKRSTPLDPKLMFCRVSNLFVTARRSMQNWLNWCH
jgi:hypothetical protein